MSDGHEQNLKAVTDDDAEERSGEDDHAEVEAERDAEGWLN
jgi:hypothetical protein